MNKYIIGIDLGGTNVKLGILNSDGDEIFTDSIKTESIKGYEYTIDKISTVIEDKLKELKIEKSNVEGIGVGVPGPVVDNSIVKFWSNFHWPQNLNMAEAFEKRIGIKTKVDNDVNVITLGEAWKGSGKGYDNILCIALGTGIGGGIIVNSHIVDGFNGAGGEIGHIKIEKNGKLCGCGQYGCWEAYASATGLIREAESRLKVNTNNLLYERTNGKEVEAKDIFDAAKDGDEFSQKLIDYEVDYVAIGLGSVLNVINPEVVVVAGGLSLAGDYFFDKLKNKLVDYAMPSTLEGLKILPAKLGNNAGVIGAAKLIKD